METFPNPQPARNYVVTVECPEFTCLCPRTGQPDFADIIVKYTPDKLCFELKDFKLYIWSFRDKGTFHEAVCNKILDDLVAAINPRWMEIDMKFKVRGGITTTVTAEHGKKQISS